MSAGEFRSSRYKADSGNIHFVMVQPETIEADFDGVTNEPPEGNINSPFAAEIGRGARSYGLRPRYVRVSFKDTPPTGYRPYTAVKIPILDSEVFSAISIDDDVTYNGGTGKLKKKISESLLPGEAVITTAVQPTDPEASL